MIFLFFESAFGICLGCLFYPIFFKEKVQNCPGEVCDVRPKQDIQKISKVQIYIIVGFFVLIFLSAILFNDSFSQKPYDLFGTNHSTLSK